MERKEELRLLRSKHAAYPGKAVRRVEIGGLHKRFLSLAKSKKSISIVGRIMATRGHGGAVFMDVVDASGKLQLLLRRDVMGETAFNKAVETLETGDFIWTKGVPFKTQRGEETLEVKESRLLAKALVPPPTHFYGLKDIEERYRNRALDLLVNDDVRQRFVARANIVELLRREFMNKGFMEVATPMLQSIPGGASARPFKTHLNALNLDLFLRVAPELYLKRLLVGGFEKIFELGTAFRNEGMDATHNPEFTILEAYWAYQDAEGLMKFVESIFENIVKKAKGGKPILFRGKEIVSKRPFTKLLFAAALKKYARLDIANASYAEITKQAEQVGVDIQEQPTREEQLDAIFKKRCLEHLWNPTFIIEHPLELSPLAKAKVPSQSEGSRRVGGEVADRFQLVVGGMEIVNAFSELNDPIEQRRRFEEQEKARKAGSQEAQRLDEEYLETMEYGMPPAAGLGIGVDRLVMLLTDAPSLREIILFPTMKPKTGERG